MASSDISRLNVEHTHMCPDLRKLKISFMKESGIPRSRANSLLYLRIRIGSGIQEMLIWRNRNRHIPLGAIKSAIMKSYFCPCCVKDIWFSNPRIWDGKLLEVTKTMDHHGVWCTNLYVDDQEQFIFDNPDELIDDLIGPSEVDGSVDE